MMEKNLKKYVTEALCYVLKLIQHCISTILQFFEILYHIKEVERFMFFRKVLGIGGNEFFPHILTHLKCILKLLWYTC